MLNEWDSNLFIAISFIIVMDVLNDKNTSFFYKTQKLVLISVCIPIFNGSYSLQTVRRMRGKNVGFEKVCKWSQKVDFDWSDHLDPKKSPAILLII